MVPLLSRLEPQGLDKANTAGDQETPLTPSWASRAQHQCWTKTGGTPAMSWRAKPTWHHPHLTSSGTPLQYSCLENPMDGGAWKAAVHGVTEGRTRLHFHFHFSLSCIGEGNGNSLQCSCLENPRDRGAWWAAVYGVAQSQTQLKPLSSSSSSNMGLEENSISVPYPPFC